jgi:hypothetical protein
MMNMQKMVGAIAVLVVVVGGYVYMQKRGSAQLPQDAAIPKPMTLTGTYMCLPHKDMSGPQTEECAFGIQADTGEFYAVNFGQSADAQKKFMQNERITAEGFAQSIESLSTNSWQKYDIKGIFTVTKILPEIRQQIQGKINIEEVCKGALAYTTFTDGAAADAFVKDCIAGNRPEVLEQFKKMMNVGDGAQL